MVVPGCGYVGALHRRKEMSFCFRSASLFLLVCFMVLLIWVRAPGGNTITVAATRFHCAEVLSLRSDASCRYGLMSKWRDSGTVSGYS